jgi:cobalt/nickel transport system permease protein
VSGAALTAAGVGIGLKRLDVGRVPQVAILSAGFFIASLVHIPIGPSNVHLILNGLLGLFLGWVAFPAILVGLVLQATLFQYGGFTTLGVNTFIMAFPAVLCFYLFRRGVRSQKEALAALSAFFSGLGAILLAGLLLALSLVSVGEQFLPVAKLVLAAHLPVMMIEGLITAVCVRFLRQVRPELLEDIYVHEKI